VDYLSSLRSDDPPEGVVLGRIVIVTTMTEDGDELQRVETDNGYGEQLGRIAALGMLEMSKIALQEP